MNRRLFVSSAAAAALHGAETKLLLPSDKAHEFGAMDMHGQPLADRHGAPLRLIDPARYGHKSAKLITSIEFVETGKGSTACDLGPYYSPSGEIQSGYDTPLDLGAKSKRKISGGVRYSKRSRPRD